MSGLQGRLQHDLDAAAEAARYHKLGGVEDTCRSAAAALDAKDARIAELETEALARSNAIRHAFATVRCAIERGERPGATTDDVLRVLVTLDIPAALECVRDGSFVR